MTDQVNEAEDRVDPYVTNGLSHPYQLVESIFILGASGLILSFLFHFSMKFIYANRIAPDGTPRFAASHRGLFCFAYVL